MATDSADVRQRLDELGERRAKLDADDAELQDEVRKALADAEAMHISMAEAARRLKMHRTTIYRVYK